MPFGLRPPNNAGGAILVSSSRPIRCTLKFQLLSTRPIDAVYHSAEIEITATMQLSFHEGVGDHRTVIVDISSRSLLGKYDFKVCRPVARRLTTSNAPAMKRYIDHVETELVSRNLHNRLCDVSYTLSLNNQDTTALREMELIDHQTVEIMAAGERRCQKIFHCNIPFSLPVAHWVHKKYAYEALDRVATGKCRNI